MRQKLRNFLNQHYASIKEKFDSSTEAEKETIITTLNDTVPGLGDALPKGEDDVNQVLEEFEDVEKVISVLWHKILMNQEAQTNVDLASENNQNETSNLNETARPLVEQSQAKIEIDPQTANASEMQP